MTDVTSHAAAMQPSHTATHMYVVHAPHTDSQPAKKTYFSSRAIACATHMAHQYTHLHHSLVLPQHLFADLTLLAKII